MKDNCKNEYTFGYLYDLWLFSVGAELADAVGFKADMLSCRVTEYNGTSDFAFPICDGRGVFINITSSRDEVGGTVFIKKSERQEAPYFVPPWLGADDRADVYYVDVEDSYKDAVLGAVRAAVEMSPVRKAYLLIRRQCRERKNVIGMLTLAEVERLFADDRVLGNTVYVIYDSPDCLRDLPPTTVDGEIDS